MSDVPTAVNRGTAWLLAAVVVASAVLNFWNIGFPFGYHNDEIIKVGFVLDGTQDFKHPILLLFLVRLANRAFGFTDPQSLVVLGRAMVALAGASTVLLSFLLASRSLRPAAALVVAAGVAVSPTLVVHAHYLKEDGLLTPLLVGSILMYVRFVDAPGGWRAAALGLFCGLATASHYKATLLLPLFALAPALMPREHPERRGGVAELYRHLALALLVAGFAWLAVNWPAVVAPDQFLEGARFELNHAIEGHDVVVTWRDAWLGFHLRWSLGPGMTWPALLLGLAGFMWALARWRQESFEVRLFAAYAAIFYFVPELSPLKPAPDFSRYVMPVVPMAIYFGVRLVDAFTPGRSPVIASAAAGLMLIAIPLYATVRLVSEMGNDTRARAAVWLSQHDGKALIEQYAGTNDTISSVTEMDLDSARQQGIRYFVTSSFRYERYFRGAGLQNQSPAVYRVHDQYARLFQLPYVEIAPAFRSFAFSNPVIRIVDIQAK